MKVYPPSAIRNVVSWVDLIQPVEKAFAAYSQGLGEAPIVVFAPAGSDGDVHVKSAWMTDYPVFTVKVASWFSARAADGRSASTGYVAVHDASTGDVLAILQDEHHLTDLRTAAAAAVVTRLLARDDARILAVLGTGVQAYLQVLAACHVRPIDTVVIWGRRANAADALRSALLAVRSDLSISVAPSAQQAVQSATVVVTATSSREPVLLGSWLEPGQHITAVGADDLTKTELDPRCFSRADLLVVDSRRDTPRFAGDLYQAIRARAVTTEDIHAEVGELVTGARHWRSGTNQITVAKLVGLGVQDLAAAAVAMQNLSRTGPGQTGDRASR
ncbi:ornithine cyclodeaminase family protein [Kribbella sp. VKM Ac-2566]|uniref:ornithine cyclodeaminase family protein n=1 Tax=Kribbella sp. VKM Ac-2566 TaxID=2512218 RepID=UPI0010CFA1FE|nr:ornithine cyclodeaminase family protein [Kribbella sp. VKM Ac-2566]TDX08310.1 ornithine cyclodeaminase [Kribbella sp. VKM Ac-2566]